MMNQLRNISKKQHQQQKQQKNKTKGKLTSSMIHRNLRFIFTCIIFFFSIANSDFVTNLLHRLPP